MKNITLKFLLLCIAVFSSNANSIDTVFSFTPGTLQSSGQSAEYFPENIFGPPSINSSYDVPNSLPEEILSIGLNGEIIVGFKSGYIIDKQGADFTIFENAFYSDLIGRVFIEPAKIAVSENGIDYFEFEFDPDTFEGCAGITPTNGSENPYDTLVSGGDSFDIAEVGLEKVKYIKITDISELMLDKEHPLYDPIVSGFDLDALIALNYEGEVTNVTEFPEEEKLMIANDQIRIELNDKIDIEIYDLNAEKIIDISGFGNLNVDTSELGSGMYFLRLITSDGIINRKFLKI